MSDFIKIVVKEDGVIKTKIINISRTDIIDSEILRDKETNIPYELRLKFMQGSGEIDANILGKDHIGDVLTQFSRLGLRI